MSSATLFKNRKPVVFAVALEKMMIESIEPIIARQGGSTIVCETPDEFLRDDSPFEIACAVTRTTHADADLTLLTAGPAARERLPVIYLTESSDVEHSILLFQRGASDVLTLPLDSRRLVDAVNEAWRHHIAMCRSRAECVGLRARLHTLTTREHEVLMLLLDGFSNKQIGAGLKICERTVKAHRKCIMYKMGVQSLVELARRMERTWLESGQEFPPSPGAFAAVEPFLPLSTPRLSGDALRRAAL
jgi:FixJ family two-component response regulator